MVIISAENIHTSSGPIHLAATLHNFGINAFPIQSLDLLRDEQVFELCDRFITNDKQLLGVSITFMRMPRAIDVIFKFINRAITRFPNLKIIVGGNVAYDYKALFKNKILCLNNVTFSMGQNREQEVINTILTLLNKTTDKIYNHSTNVIKYSTVFKNFKQTPKGIIYYLDLSRGCFFNCSFCAYPLRGSVSTFKSEDLIVEELEDFYKTFGTPVVQIMCNTFNDNVNKVRTLMRAVSRLSFEPEFFMFVRLDLFASQPQDVKEFIWKYGKFIFLGIEVLDKDTCLGVKKSGNIIKIQDELLKFKQNTTGQITAGLLVGLPNSKIEDIAYTIDWIVNNRAAHLLSFNALRLNKFKDDLVDILEFSDIEKNPDEFGYSIFDHDDPFAENGSFKSNPISEKFYQNSNWIRSDGYTFEQALIDVNKFIKINEYIPRSRSIFARARGVSMDIIKDTVAELTFIKHNGLQISEELLNRRQLLQSAIDTFGKDYFKCIFNIDL